MTRMSPAVDASSMSCMNPTAAMNSPFAPGPGSCARGGGVFVVPVPVPVPVCVSADRDGEASVTVAVTVMFGLGDRAVFVRSALFCRDSKTRLASFHSSKQTSFRSDRSVTALKLRRMRAP